MVAPWPPSWPKKAELHIFDPDGDVLLILDRCVKEDDLAESVDDGLEFGKQIPWVEDEVPPCSADDPNWPPIEAPSDEPQAEMLEAEADVMSKLEISASAFSATQRAQTRIEKVQMRASSKHLILASSTFRLSLGSDTYSEGWTLQTEGALAIPLPDEDPDVMIILLNIIHGRSKKVPRQVDLNVLTRLAVAVNYRQMHEVVELWSDSWIAKLETDEGLPECYTPELVLSWLFICWVFRKNDGFTTMSGILSRECDHSLESELEAVYVGSYIPASIIRTIQERRIDAIERMLAVIHDLITKYSRPDIICRNERQFSCDAKLLGSLVKSCAIVGIWPPPKSPYPGINVTALAAQRNASLR